MRIYSNKNQKNKGAVELTPTAPPNYRRLFNIEELLVYYSNRYIIICNSNAMHTINTFDNRYRNQRDR